MSSSGKNSIKRILGSRIFLFFVCLVLIGLAISVGRESYRKYQLTKEIERFKTEVEQIEGRNRYLSDLMGYLKDDLSLEQEAKIKLNLKKPGENVVIIEHSKIEKENSQERKEEPESNESRIDLMVPEKEEERTANYWQWWNYFFGQ